MENDRCESAVALACVGLEELAKLRVCLDLLKEDSASLTSARVEEFWKLWYDHARKAGQAFTTIDFAGRQADFFAGGISAGLVHAGMKGLLTLESGQPVGPVRFLVNLREAALYTDFVRSGHGAEYVAVGPETVVEESVAGLVIAGLRKLFEYVELSVQPVLETPQG